MFCFSFWKKIRHRVSTPAGRWERWVCVCVCKVNHILRSVYISIYIYICSVYIRCPSVSRGNCRCWKQFMLQNSCYDDWLYGRSFSSWSFSPGQPRAQVTVGVELRTFSVRCACVGFLQVLRFPPTSQNPWFRQLSFVHDGLTPQNQCWKVEFNFIRSDFGKFFFFFFQSHPKAFLFYLFIFFLVSVCF